MSPFSGGGPIYSNSETFNSASFVASAISFLDTGFDGNGYFNSLNITPEPVPEPAGGVLTLVGIALVGVARRWAARQKSVRA